MVFSCHDIICRLGYSLCCDFDKVLMKEIAIREIVLEKGSTQSLVVKCLSLRNEPFLAKASCMHDTTTVQEVLWTGNSLNSKLLRQT